MLFCSCIKAKQDKQTNEIAVEPVPELHPYERKYNRYLEKRTELTTDIQAQIDKARDLLREHDRPAALECVQTKKWREGQLEELDAPWSKLSQILRATADGNVAIVAQLIADGVSVNGCNAFPSVAVEEDPDEPHPAIPGPGPDVPRLASALHIAALNDCEPLAQLLLDNGARVSSLDASGHSPLWVAVDKGYGDMIDILLAAAAPCQAVLVHAARLGRVDVVRRLVELGTDANGDDDTTQGSTKEVPVEVAAEAGQRAVVHTLMELGAKPASKKRMMATLDRHEALAMAAAGDATGIASKTDFTVTDYLGRLPIHIAAAEGHEAVVRALLAGGVAVNARDGAGQTPLHSASSRGRVGVVVALVEAGAVLAIQDAEGRTAYDLADAAGYDGVTSTLHEAAKPKDGVAGVVDAELLVMGTKL